MPSGSVVPVLLTAHDRAVQTGCGNVDRRPGVAARLGRRGHRAGDRRTGPAPRVADRQRHRVGAGHVGTRATRCAVVLSGVPSPQFHTYRSGVLPSGSAVPVLCERARRVGRRAGDGAGSRRSGPVLPAGSVMVTSRVTGAPALFHESVTVRVIV